MLSDFIKGDTLEFELYFKDTYDNPIDISGSRIWFTMKEDPTAEDSEAALQLSQINFIKPKEGYTLFIVDASETSKLKPDTTYYYDIQIVFLTGIVKTIEIGKVRVLQDVTKTI